MLYGHGDDFYNAKNEVKINFSSNVWHGANLDKLKEHLIEHFGFSYQSPYRSHPVCEYVNQAIPVYYLPG